MRPTRLDGVESAIIIKPCVTPRSCETEQRRVASINSLQQQTMVTMHVTALQTQGKLEVRRATGRRDAGQWVYHDGYEGSHPQCPRRCDGKDLNGEALVPQASESLWKWEA
jgi:hypothetical protein